MLNLFFDLQTWTQWDQSHYLDIASSGYRAFQCLPQSGFNQGDWCGNASWFPFYPFLIAFFSLFLPSQLSPTLIGLFIANVSFLAILLIIIPSLSEDLGHPANTGNLIYRVLFFTFFPSSIYLHAVYPLSLAIFFAGISLHYIYRNQLLRSILPIFLSCLSYPAMVVLSVPISVYLASSFFSQRLDKSSKPFIFLSAFCSIAPFLAYKLAQTFISVSSGVPNAFDLVGAKYGHSVHNPIYSFKSVLLRALTLNDYSSLQTVFLIVCIIIVFNSLIVNLANSPHGSFLKSFSDNIVLFSLLSFACAVLILPMVVGGAVSTYRTESLSSLPIAIIVEKYIRGTMPRILVLSTSVILFAVSLKLFLEGSLV